MCWIVCVDAVDVLESQVHHLYMPLEHASLYVRSIFAALYVHI
jgi:hypothetical protein